MTTSKATVYIIHGTYRPRARIHSPMQRSYVRYPPEGPRPPTLEEFQELLKKEKQQRK